MERDFKGIWIPKEIWNKYKMQIAILACAYYQDPSLLTETEIRYLKENNILVKTNFNAENIKKVLSDKRPHKGIGTKQCSWCKCTTVVLHEHHYPISKKDGGTETVSICPNCHYEFYYLMDSTYKLNDEIFNEIRRATKHEC